MGHYDKQIEAEDNIRQERKRKQDREDLQGLCDEMCEADDFVSAATGLRYLEMGPKYETLLAALREVLRSS